MWTYQQVVAVGLAGEVVCCLIKQAVGDKAVEGVQVALRRRYGMPQIDAHLPVHARAAAGAIRNKVRMHCLQNDMKLLTQRLAFKFNPIQVLHSRM